MENPPYEIQPIGEDHYKPTTYDHYYRWLAYWHQINAIQRSGARRVLEIGLGSGTLTFYLRHQMGLDVTTFDYDAGTSPDVQGDMRNIGRHFPADSFDAVLAFQVLEHIPFEDVPGTLEQLARITRQHLILSLPYHGSYLQVRLRIWRLKLAFARKISRRVNWTYNGVHYWEIGTRQYPLQRVLDVLGRQFVIQRHYFCPDYAYHYFFECVRKANVLS